MCSKTREKSEAYTRRGGETPRFVPMHRKRCVTDLTDWPSVGVAYRPSLHN
jgi:hypothetical protein